MRQVVVYVFYLWLALSFLYLVLQMVRKLTSGSAVAKPADAEPADAEPADAEPAVAPLAEPSGDHDLVARLLAEEAAQAEQARTAENVPATVAGQRPKETVPNDTNNEQGTIGSPPRTEPDTLRVPAEPVLTDVADLDALPPPSVVLDASAPDATKPMAAVAPDVAAEPAPPRPRPSLSTLLAGIRLPHDLMPVVPDQATIDDAHVSLLTSTAPAAVVGPAIADELERLGYALEPKNENELIARRDADELILGIVTSPTLLSEGGRPCYPSATEGDVLITIDAVS